MGVFIQSFTVPRMYALVKAGGLGSGGDGDGREVGGDHDGVVALPGVALLGPEFFSVGIAWPRLASWIEAGA